MAMSAFRELRASELYCPNCRRAQPVRERLLLVLPRAELHEYRCAVCAASLGTREAPVPRAAPRIPLQERRPALCPPTR